MSNLSDTTLTTLDLNPDSNWTGVQAQGAVSAAVYLGARGGVTHSTVTNFTTTHSGTGQYIIQGLTPGTYTITMNSTPVSGSPFTVGTNDNTAYFESTSGTVSISAGGASTPPDGIGGTAKAAGAAVIHLQ